jgi:putative transposase
MGSRSYPLTTNEIYSVYNRGNSKQIIFHDEEDYLYFQKLLFIMNQVTRMRSERTTSDPYALDRDEPLVAIGAYCLMPNHFHLLLLQKAEDGISKFMQKLSTAYVMYYNNKHDHSGSLFEGKYKTTHASDDDYIKSVFAYIHLNPLKILHPDWKAMLANKVTASEDVLTKHPYSSIHYFLGAMAPEDAIIDTEGFPAYIFSSKDFLHNIHKWFVSSSLQ